MLQNFDTSLLPEEAICAGDWEAAEKRAAAGPDKEGASDDEVFGDFEDMEAGKRHGCHIFAVQWNPVCGGPCLWCGKSGIACYTVVRTS